MRVKWALGGSYHGVTWELSGSFVENKQAELSSGCRDSRLGPYQGIEERICAKD